MRPGRRRDRSPGEGHATAGVQRQHSGAAGRIDNRQTAVFPACAVRHGRAFVDRRLRLPESRASAPARHHKTGVPDETGFATRTASRHADDHRRAGHRDTRPADHRRRNPRHRAVKSPKPSSTSSLGQKARSPGTGRLDQQLGGLARRASGPSPDRRPP
ncbi:transposase [Streptomyces sp. enrichment culture]|uniref:transposase n=1 Tax=Streptomyces sp. enrichment culture TaxID=1795815 RepID=UPI003F55F8ED